MIILIGLTIMLFGTQQTAAICYPNTVCSEERDTITHLDASVLPSEKEATGMRSRAWYIQPVMDRFNVILAFKNFSSPDDIAVMVISYQSTNKSTTKHIHGSLEDFELVIEDTIGVVIYVPLHQNRSTNFVLNYYSGCEFLTAEQDQINYVNPLSVNYVQKKCWLINPKNKRLRKRFYFSIRSVNLNRGQEIAIWDIHTSNLIATASNGNTEQVIAAEPSDYALILVDLICSQSYCDSNSNSFLVSYYALTQEDLDCQRTQRECYRRRSIPRSRCNATCPAFDNMIIEEYGLQVRGNAAPIVRSGGRLQNQVSSAQSNIYCPYGRQQCDCLYNTVNPTQYCGVKCLQVPGNCFFACIYFKMAECIRIKILASLVLL